MPLQPSLLWTWNRTIDRVPYLLTGIVLFLIKFAIDWTIATRGFGQSWSPLNYLIWPNDRAVPIAELDGPQRAFTLTMLLVSLPFIWTGIMLTLHRLRAAGLPRGLVVLFFVPLVNLFLFLMLSLLPTREAAQTDLDAGKVGRAHPTQPARPFEPLRRVHRFIVLESYWRSGALALALTVPVIVLGVLLGTQAFGHYGYSLFVGAPFALGMISVLLFGFSRPQPFGKCIGVAMTSGFIAGMATLVFAIEGAICLLMAAPIAFALVFLGALVGYTIQSRPWLSDQAANLMLVLLMALPALMAAEWAGEPTPEVRAIETEVIINAPPAEVWPLVIAFPPLPEPDDWFFKAGIAYPQRAEIVGMGVGAVRHCIFSTGTFVEPIEVWDPPRLLRFRVIEQPAPLREWSPFHIHPAHLDHYLCSHQGQFLLEALPGGRTRLIGTTWYSNRMWPAAYWNLWSDAIIHRIHTRVLNHIKTLAEERKATMWQAPPR